MIPELGALLQRLRRERPDETNETPIPCVHEAQKSMDRAAFAASSRDHCIESGVDIPTVSRWLGHKGGGALCIKTYGHLRRSAKIFPWWREHLDLLRVLNDLDAVLDVRRDGVSVAGSQLVS
jgi:hypothetical protein